MSTLVLERKSLSPDPPILTSSGTVFITPLLDADYWSYRVQLKGDQAIVGFPKFTTIGIGFAREEDWDTNLPYTSSVEEIFSHIAHNKGDVRISDEDCIAAIRLIQQAALADRGRR